VSTRSGIGYDSHRLLAGRPLVLGGVVLPAERGLDGHSDADVLTHAVIDALLGAAGLGDIGEHFPDSDDRYRDADSLILLAAVLDLVRGAGFEPVNVDATIVMERPKLGELRVAIRERLAQVLGIAIGDVNIKASTGEGIGFVGREEGVAAIAIATLRRERAAVD
jgi:2-C-methyl-D-erythritol 2,4-cyclodiphosphate synthase